MRKEDLFVNKSYFLAGIRLVLGDVVNRRNLLKPHIHRYETVWLFLVVPLRSPNSIYLRDGIDEEFEEFAMCHYTTYVNLGRALEKINAAADDFNFAEEIWANMNRAVEVAIKAVLERSS